MFTANVEREYTELLPGIEIKSLVHGEKTLLAEFKLKKGEVLPRHSHPYEQTGYLVSGKIRFYLGDESFDAVAGDAWNVPLDVEHSVDVLEDSLVVEVFSPVRPDYLPENLG